MRHKQIGERLIGRDKKRGIELWNFEIKRGVELDKPEKYISPRGEEEFDPVLYLLEDKEGNRQLWFPYWISINKKWRYGQYAPIFTEENFSELLKKGIEYELFTELFLKQLKRALEIRKRQKL